MSNKLLTVMGIFLIFTIGFSVALPAESQITLKEIEDELGQGRKLDKAEIWRRLGIKSKDKECKDRFLEKGT